tara:strand:- start:78 stop:299 length:222 start_codon:yes stop_codon:yes gene_type:complete
MPKKKISKTQKLLKHMLTGKTINGRQALSRFGIYRLSAVIFDWRKRGFDIETNMITRLGSTYAVYKMKGTPNV